MLLGGTNLVPSIMVTISISVPGVSLRGILVVMDCSDCVTVVNLSMIVKSAASSEIPWPGRSDHGMVSTGLKSGGIVPNV